MAPTLLRRRAASAACRLRHREFIGLTAGANPIFVVGPSRLAELAAHEIDLTLDELERGSRRIILDEDGNPRLV
jgi:hypothetical protein